jgi:putative phage-type endonuclease
MEQGSNSWHEWRDSGLGSSDAPVIMEAEGAYSTRHKLYLDKLKLSPVKTEKEIKSKKFIYDKGHHIEAMVRGRYEIKEDMCFASALFERADKPFMKASVDLCNHEKKLIKEVKYVSLEVFDEGKCPAKYFPQIQWQYLITDYTIDLVLATDYMWVNEETKEEKIKIPTKEGFRTKEVKVKIDKKYCHDLYWAGCLFWNEHILKKIPPALSEKDAIPVTGKDVILLLKKYAAIEKKLDKAAKLEKDKKALIDEIFKHPEIKHPIMKFGKMKITLTAKKGTIDYKTIPAISKMTEDELENYRGASSVSRSIKC